MADEAHAIVSPYRGQSVGQDVEYLKRFQNHHQIAALKYATSVRGDMITFDYNFILKFNNPHQVEALKHAIAVRGMSIHHDYGHILKFTNSHQVRALKCAIPFLGVFIRYHYGHFLKFKNPYQIEALEYIIPFRKMNVRDDYDSILKFENQYQIKALEHIISIRRTNIHYDYNFLLKFRNTHQTDALKYASPARKINISSDYGHILKFRNPHQIEALKIAIPILGHFITNHAYNYFLKFSNHYQIEALKAIAKFRPKSINQLHEKVLQFSKHSQLAALKFGLLIHEENYHHHLGNYLQLSNEIHEELFNFITHQLVVKAGYQDLHNLNNPQAIERVKKVIKRDPLTKQLRERFALLAEINSPQKFLFFKAAYSQSKDIADAIQAFVQREISLHAKFLDQEARKVSTLDEINALLQANQLNHEEMNRLAKKIFFAGHEDLLIRNSLHPHALFSFAKQHQLDAKDLLNQYFDFNLYNANSFILNIVKPLEQNRSSEFLRIVIDFINKRFHKMKDFELSVGDWYEILIQSDSRAKSKLGPYLLSKASNLNQMAWIAQELEDSDENVRYEAYKEVRANISRLMQNLEDYERLEQFHFFSNHPQRAIFLASIYFDKFDNPSDLIDAFEELTNREYPTTVDAFNQKIATVLELGNPEFDELQRLLTSVADLSKKNKISALAKAIPLAQNSGQISALKIKTVDLTLNYHLLNLYLAKNWQLKKMMAKPHWCKNLFKNLLRPH